MTWTRHWWIQKMLFFHIHQFSIFLPKFQEFYTQECGYPKNACILIIKCAKLLRYQTERPYFVFELDQAVWSAHTFKQCALIKIFCSSFAIVRFIHPSLLSNSYCIIVNSANQTLFCLCLRALPTKIFWNSRNIEKIGSKLKIPRIVSFRVFCVKEILILNRYVRYR